MRYLLRNHESDPYLRCASFRARFKISSLIFRSLQFADKAWANRCAKPLPRSTRFAPEGHPVVSTGWVAQLLLDELADSPADTH
jgi:hypothetical protein